MSRILLRCALASLAICATAGAQQSDQETIKDLLRRLALSEQRLEASERRIAALEEKLGLAVAVTEPTPGAFPSGQPASGPGVPAQSVPPGAAGTPPEPGPAETTGHNMQIPHGGPVLNIRGFFDFNFGTGSIANPLIFPVASNGCVPCGNPPTPPHTGFQAGELDLFMTSRLSEHWDFLAEMVVGTDTTNEFSVDLERYQLTWTPSEYFAFSAGRFHTAIGYYNTAYHHGNWFSTAEGRPIMYLFEDTGGVLPIHTVGVTMTGLVPQSGKLGLHWVAEIGNGRASNPAVAESVQNLYADRNHKAFNLAAYTKPAWVPGLQIGGSYYRDRLTTPATVAVSQDIGSAYVVYNTAQWEFLNEAVLLSNHVEGTPLTFRSPMAYTQIARAFGIYRPYFRYQYVNDRPGDPVNILHGLYYGPSVGIRIDYSEYAAFKLQYNRLLEGRLPAANGLNGQIAFTF